MDIKALTIILIALVVAIKEICEVIKVYILSKHHELSPSQLSHIVSANLVKINPSIFLRKIGEVLSTLEP